jgi:hypothetical protein
LSVSCDLVEDGFPLRLWAPTTTTPVAVTNTAVLPPRPGTNSCPSFDLDDHGLARRQRLRQAERATDRADGHRPPTGPPLITSWSSAARHVLRAPAGCYLTAFGAAA